jgi:hypothetical protein
MVNGTWKWSMGGSTHRMAYKEVLVKECLIWFTVFGVERNVRKEAGRCFKHHFLKDTLVIIIYGVEFYHM